MNRLSNYSQFLRLAFAEIMLAASSAAAFTVGNADTLIDSFNSAYYTASGANGSYKNSKSGGDPGFWQQAVEIDALESAYDRTDNTTYLPMISTLLNGFESDHGTSWASNGSNSDIMWACLAYLRGYRLTGNTTFLTIAKANFDMADARGYDTFAGGFYSDTTHAVKTSMVNGLASMVAYELSQALGDSSYQDKAIAINNWQQAHCFNQWTGQVYTSPANPTATTINQATFISASYNCGNPIGATTACDYLMSMGATTTVSTPYKILPFYGLGSSQAGYNGIAIRLAAKFMADMKLYPKYLDWLQANAQAAWAATRPSDFLSWSDWHHPLQNETAVTSWDCVSSVSALQAVPIAYPSADPNGRTHFQRNVTSYRGKTIDLVFDGDSITDSWQSTGSTIFANHFGGMKTADFGISGDRIETLYWRLLSGQMDGLDPKLVVLLIGTNNTPTDTSTEIAEGIKSVVKEYLKRCPNAQILLMGVFPRQQSAANPVRAKIIDVNTRISMLNGGRVTYLDIRSQLLQADGTLSASIMGDYLHPTPAGYEIWANAIQSLVNHYVLGSPLPTPTPILPPKISPPDSPTIFSKNLAMQQSGKVLRVRGILSDPDTISNLTAFVDGKRTRVKFSGKDDRTQGVWNLSLQWKKAKDKILLRAVDGRGTISTKIYRVRRPRVISIGAIGEAKDRQSVPAELLGPIQLTSASANPDVPL